MIRVKYAQQLGIKIGFKGFSLNNEDDDLSGKYSKPADKSKIVAEN